MTGKIKVTPLRLQEASHRTRTNGHHLSAAKSSLSRTAHDVAESFSGFSSATALTLCAQSWDRHLHEMANALDSVATNVQSAARHYDAIDQRVEHGMNRGTNKTHPDVAQIELEERQMQHSTDRMNDTWFGTGA